MRIDLTFLAFIDLSDKKIFELQYDAIEIYINSFWQVTLMVIGLFFAKIFLING